MKIGNSTIVIVRVFLVYWKSKETSVTLWLYDFFWQFEQWQYIFHHQQMQQNILTHYCNNISKSCKKRDAILSSNSNSTNVAPLAKILMLQKNWHYHKWFYNGSLFEFVNNFAPWNQFGYWLTFFKIDSAISKFS